MSIPVSLLANPQPDLWSQRTALFRRLLRRFTQPTHGFLAELDALEAWCMHLVDPALPGAATLESPFAGLHTPEGAAQPSFAATPAKTATSPALHGRPPRRPLTTPSGSAAGPQPGSPVPADAAPRVTDAPDTRPAASRDGAPPGAAAAGIVLPVRGKATGTSAAARAASASHPAETPAPDPPGARMLRPSDLLPAAIDAALPPPDLAGSPVNSVAAAAARLTPATGVRTNGLTGSDATVAAGLHLLAALTSSLYGRAPAAAPQMPASAPPQPMGAVPWRADNGQPPVPLAATEAAPSAAASGTQPAPFSPAAPDSPALLAPQPVAPDMPWPRPAPFAAPFTLPLDADLLADLVNEALLEQARRHGANLP